MAWTWRLQQADGKAADGLFDVPDFPSQSDAESWIGEVWRALAEAGVGQVLLMEGDHLVYGPMSLAAEEAALRSCRPASPGAWAAGTGGSATTGSGRRT